MMMPALRKAVVLSPVTHGSSLVALGGVCTKIDRQATTCISNSDSDKQEGKNYGEDLNMQDINLVDRVLPTAARPVLPIPRPKEEGAVNYGSFQWNILSGIEPRGLPPPYQPFSGKTSLDSDGQNAFHTRL